MSVGLVSLVGADTVLLSLRSMESEVDRRESMDARPTVSVVICAYNEEQNIAALLRSLISDHVHEIVVVASGCTDRTVQVARGFQTLHPRLKVLAENERNGKTSAVNLALATVTSKYVVFMPADVRPGKGSIAKLVEGFKPEIGIRVGRPVPVDSTRTLIGRLSQLIWTLHNRTLEELSAEGSLGHASGEFFAIRRGIINRLPTDVVNDDAYIAVFVRRAGYDIDYENHAVVYLKGPGSVRDYISQRRRVLFGHVQVMLRTGRYPTVFETQAVAHPSLFLRILRGELKGLSGGFRTLVMGTTLELVSLTLSGFDRVMGRTHVLWRMVESTKSLPGSLSLPLGGINGIGIISVSKRDAYLEQSLGRNLRSDLAHGQLSQRLEVAALLPYRCY